MSRVVCGPRFLETASARRLLGMLAILLGCGREPITGPTTPEPAVPIRIQVQGTVTAAGDGSPIPAARVAVANWLYHAESSTVTNDQGEYSLTLTESTRTCNESFLQMFVGGDGFWPVGFSQYDTPHVRCTENVQTIDVELEAIG